MTSIFQFQGKNAPASTQKFASKNDYYLRWDFSLSPFLFLLRGMSQKHPQHKKSVGAPTSWAPTNQHKN